MRTLFVGNFQETLLKNKILKKMELRKLTIGNNGFGKQPSPNQILGNRILYEKYKK